MQRTVLHFALGAAFCASALLTGCVRMDTPVSGPTAAGTKSVIRTNDVAAIDTPWGSLQWLVSGAGGSSENMTLGRVTFKAGQANPPHYHSNCEEILYVISGRLEHTLPGGGTTVLNAGDTIVLPRGEMHFAKNVGTEDAVVIVAFDSANRQTAGE